MKLIIQKKSGIGILSHSDGERYAGELTDGKINGIGITKFNDDTTYAGEFTAGYKNGIGIHTTSERKTAGEFENGEVKGLRINILSDDTKYVGENIYNTSSGIVVMIFPNGKKMTGEFADGKKNGISVIINPDGRKHAGEFIDDKFNGLGIFTSSIKKYKYAGEIKENKTNGIGISMYSDGHKHVGEYEDNKTSGIGLLLMSNNFKLFGEFRDSKFIENQDSILTVNKGYSIYNNVYYLFVDTETTGLPLDWRISSKYTSNWPRLVQIACILCDSNGTVIAKMNSIVKPDGFTIPSSSTGIHGITTQMANDAGKQIAVVLEKFNDLLKQADYMVAHNIEFDENVIAAEFIRNGFRNTLERKRKICTMKSTTNFCMIQGNSYNFKWPTSPELYYKLFKEEFEETHNAVLDVEATMYCFWELKKQEIL